MRAGLVKSNQFPRVVCERVDCPLCSQQAGDNRSVTRDKDNVGYKGECTRCQAGAVAYIEETSKTAYTRLSQHLAAYKTASAAQLPAQSQHVDPLSSKVIPFYLG